jgi:hypothetical protein
MSVRIMSEVFTRYPSGGGEMLLALALADHASDDGSRVWPSIPSLAVKTRQSERAVQLQLRKMESCGWLIKVSSKKIGRGQTVEYRISEGWIKGENISPFVGDAETKRVKTETQKGENISPFVGDAETKRVKTETQKGEKSDIVYKEESSKEPPVVFTNVNTPPRVSTQIQKPETSTIEFDVEQKSFTNIGDEQMAQWEDAYRGLDIDAELTRAESWYIANPRKRKRNHQRFLVNWLARAHDRMRAPIKPKPKPQARAMP